MTTQEQQDTQKERDVFPQRFRDSLPNRVQMARSYFTKDLPTEELAKEKAGFPSANEFQSIGFNVDVLENQFSPQSPVRRDVYLTQVFKHVGNTGEDMKTAFSTLDDALEEFQKAALVAPKEALHLLTCEGNSSVTGGRGKDTKNEFFLIRQACLSQTFATAAGMEIIRTAMALVQSALSEEENQNDSSSVPNEPRPTLH